MREQDEVLNAQLGAFHRRIKGLIAERMLCRGLMVAGVLALLLILIDLVTVWYVTPFILAVVFLLGALAGLAYGYLRPLDKLAVAITVDQRLGLKERASTALALATGADSHPEFRDLVANDALVHLAGHKPEVVFPNKFTREHKYALGIWVAVIVAFLLPMLPFWYSPGSRADLANMEDAGHHLKVVARQIQQDPSAQKDKELMKLAKRMQRLANELEKKRIPKKEALKRLNKLNEDIMKAQKDIAERQFKVNPGDLKTAADAFQKAMDARSPEEKAAAKRAFDKLKQGIPREKLTNEEREAFDRQEKLKQIANQLADNQLDDATESLRELASMMNSANMSQSQRQALANAMQQMASATSGNKQMSKQFQQAAKGLRQNNAAGQRQAARALQQMPTVTALNKAVNQMQGDMQAAKQQIAGMLRGTYPGKYNGNRPGNGAGNGAGKGNGKGKGRGGRGGGTGGLMENTGSDDPTGKHTVTMNNNNNSTDHSVTIDSDLHGAPAPGESSNVPYYDVYSQYRNKAETAISSDQVPVAERKKVKDYFGALDPNNPGK